jgi:hypothetical protein
LSGMFRFLDSSRMWKYPQYYFYYQT